jgi:peptidoglycan/LPS O-acetylase OafA/YrhL
MPASTSALINEANDNQCGRNYHGSFMHEREQEYRPDIDGLRAVAVLAVVAYHAFPQWLPGGYVGVDIFFVISGYLISGQLMASAAGDRFSLLDFYGRRIRRILPALIVVLAATAAVGWWVLLPEEWTALRTHVAASAVFSNNLVLWSEGGYFDDPAELKPLLHLWSLGVEEQFYLVWPLLIWWWWRRNIRWDSIIALTMLASFGINVMLVESGAAKAAFFLPHARLWQLATGALLAAATFGHGTSVASRFAPLIYRTRGEESGRRLANLLSVTGLLLVMLSCIALDRGSVEASWWSGGAFWQVNTTVQWIARALWLDGSDAAYPGWSALAPTAGAALVIAAGPAANWNRLWLSPRPVVFIGLISYPLYLWHWPLLSFLQITEQGEVTRPMKAVAIAIAMVLATLTYLLIERPIRRALRTPTPARLVPLLASLAGIGLIMLISIRTGWLVPPPRTAVTIDAAVPTAQHERQCRDRYQGLGEYCQQFDPQLPVTTALLGDSHAAHFFPGLGAVLQSRGQNLVQLGQTGCPPLLNVQRLNAAGDNGCVRVNTAVINAVLSDPAIVNVWLAFRGALAVEGNGFDDGSYPATLFRSVDGDGANGAAIEQGFRETITALKARGKRVGIILQIPELGFRVDTCTGRPVSLSRRPANASCGVAVARVRQRQARYGELVARMQREYGVDVFDPSVALCDGEVCHAVTGGRMLYHDDNHLGIAGSSWVMRAFN